MSARLVFSLYCRYLQKVEAELGQPIGTTKLSEREFLDNWKTMQPDERRRFEVLLREGFRPRDEEASRRVHQVIQGFLGRAASADLTARVDRFLRHKAGEF